MKDTIMQALINLPAEIKHTEQEVYALRLVVANRKADIAKRELEIKSSRDAKEWGSNETDRKTNQTIALTEDEIMQGLQADLAIAEGSLAGQEIELRYQLNNFSAMKAIARMYQEE